MANPLAGNPLRTRADVQRAVCALFAPLRPHFSPGGARVRLGSAGAFFADAAAELEGFARPLWGLVPLAMGGGRVDDWDLYRRGLAAGTDPDHPEFWGWPETDQRQVEMAALGFALAFVPEAVWEPLPADAKDRLAAWLARIDRFEPIDSNWQFFRVLVNLGLARVGRPFDERAHRESLELLDSHYLGDGWYRDGASGHLDYYIPWAYHTYGLVYAASHGTDPERARVYRERARRFARDFEHWFDPGGAAIPFGRSLTYRFAQGCFWGALVFADEEALPWGRVKGLYLRHLREWARHPISDRDGVLSLGYAYSNPLAVEPYSSPGSPYWCMKAFLALAAPETHPFWSAEEEPMAEPEAPRAQPHPGMLISRTPTQTVALCAGQTELVFPNGPAKYAKFAYSSRFGFGVALHETRPHQNCHDSMLALRGADGPWRVREQAEAHAVEDGCVYSRWRPFPDVVVETVLTGTAPWHLRLHRLVTSRRLWSAEAGFALPWDGVLPGGRGFEREGGPEAPLARTEAGESGVRDESGGRTGAIMIAHPNTNLLAPHTVVPVLHGEHAPGTHWLSCAVLATDRSGEARWEAPPALPAAARRLLERMADRKEAAREGLRKIGSTTNLGDTALWLDADQLPRQPLGSRRPAAPRGRDR